MNNIFTAVYTIDRKLASRCDIKKVEQNQKDSCLHAIVDKITSVLDFNEVEYCYTRGHEMIYTKEYRGEYFDGFSYLGTSKRVTFKVEQM